MQNDERPFIEYDMEKIYALKEEYELNLKFIKENLPPINWNSPKQIKALFMQALEISLKNVTISHVQSFMDRYDHDSAEFDLINGAVLYLKTKFTLNNYINCIVKHNDSGRIYLRKERGAWLLPNKRPLSTSPEIQQCEIRTTNSKE